MGLAAKFFPSAFSFERGEEKTNQSAPDFSFQAGERGWQARFPGNPIAQSADAQGAFPRKGQAGDSRIGSRVFLSHVLFTAFVSATGESAPFTET